ncbi:hypothetical protein LOC67_09640 [Stieleria sp. JC731]|uniref:MG2 domain-containing protein n=1 Tax=Pirellulaceae TaxID=2691357 RepID=UPI001E61C21A|nr:MG2 domain-containing protein [Stieleria sp. JC731]MCC9600827.1 hypothetical protein [Stieleria sp. JC731]
MNLNQPPQQPLPNDDDLEQLLLELHYGLLDDDEADELRRRIETEPHVAAQWAETLVMANKFAQAARRDASKESPVGLQSAESTTVDHIVNTPSATAVDSVSDLEPAGGSNSNRFIKLWWVSFAAAAVFLVAVNGYRHWISLPEPPDDPFHLAIQSIDADQSNSRNEFFVVVNPRLSSTKTVGFDPTMPIVPATISFEVLSKGAVLFRGQTETSANHPARIQIPDEIVIPADAKLEIDAWTDRSGEKKVRLSVPLEPTRCLTFLRSDRPVYRPGEQVFFRSVTLNRQTLASHIEVPIRYELLDPSGAAVSGAVLEGVTERGVGNGSFLIPESAPGGTYQLIAKSLDGFFPDQPCDIEIRRYRAVQLKTDLQFDKRSYGANDNVKATLSVRRANDQLPVGAAAKIQATVDGQTIYQSSAVVDVDGIVAITFDLPSFLREGTGTLSVAIDDGSVTETASRPIPIHTGRVQVDFFPEGGYLASGLQNRVYFAARNAQGEPIELAGEILSQAGRVVATAKTVRDGLGRFEFKPEPGMRYSLRVTNPMDITEMPWLPSVVDDKPVLNTGSGVFEADEPISISVHTLKRRQCMVRAVCRGELVGLKSVDVSMGENQITIPVQDRAAGVIRLTVLEVDTDSETTVPLVERLVYRRGQKALNIKATVDGKSDQFSPGEPVRMTIAVTDENQKPVPGAILGVSVVDDAALSLRLKEQPSIKTHFYLTSEVQSPEDLEHANFYLSDDPQAGESLDLLLGTQGWRRFVSGTPGQFNETFRSALVRLLELDGNREQLESQTRTNSDALRSQLIAYRIRAKEIWNEFINDVRFTLMLIGFVWLIALLFRPRKSFAAAASLLLISVLIVGCGQAGNTVTEAPAYNSVVEAELFQKDQGNAYRNAAEQGMSESPEEAAGASSSADSADEVKPSFARRVIEVFIPGTGRLGPVKDGQVIENRISEKQLRQFAEARGIDTQALADQLMEELRFPIRQYSHLHRTSEDSVRSDFTETLYWNPLMVTDSTGTASIRFDLSDSLTMFKVIVNGHTVDGRIGTGGGSLTSEIPLAIDAKVPLEVTGGDRIDLPVGLVNASGSTNRFDVQLVPDTGLNAAKTTSTLEVEAEGRRSERFSLDVDDVAILSNTKLKVSVQNQSGRLRDAVERSVRVVPDGYPFSTSSSGTLVRRVKTKLDLPAEIRPGSLHGEIQLMPGTQSQLSRGVESLLREPHGCFEQASSTNYPNVMAFQLMQADGVADDSDRQRIESLLRRGYRKLTSYECQDLGYEWFGNDPGHEALSAFGLMQFTEMSKVIDVDQAMLDRTRRWLLNRRDGLGGFKRNPRHLHVWSVNQETVNAYVLWALSQADLSSGNSQRTENDFTKELDHLESIATTTDDPYLIALSSITLENVGRKSTAQLLRERLLKSQAADGHVEGQMTVTQSGGLSRKVESTALAILAWKSDPQFDKALRKSVDWLLANRNGGGFGSTQATVLALKALVEVHTRISQSGEGELELLVDGNVIETLEWSGAGKDGVAYRLPDQVCRLLESDPQATVELRSANPTSLPFVVQLGGQTRSPQSHQACPLEMNVQFSDSVGETNAGDTIDVLVNVSNKTQQGQPMSVAVVGLPGGLEPVIESLDRLKDGGEIDYYELRGREVVLYWRTFQPQETKELSINCVAQIPGRYTGPAHRAYLYYTAEQKVWVNPLVIEIR